VLSRYRCSKLPQTPGGCGKTGAPVSRRFHPSLGCGIPSGAHCLKRESEPSPLLSFLLLLMFLSVSRKNGRGCSESDSEFLSVPNPEQCRIPESADPNAFASNINDSNNSSNNNNDNISKKQAGRV